MSRRTTKMKTPKKRIPPPPGPDASYEEIIAYHSKYTLDELEEAGYAEEPSPEEIRELEESAERHFERQKVKGLAKEYPKTNRARTAKWIALLNALPGLRPRERKQIANALDVIADRSHDVDELANRLLLEKHTPEEVGELLLAFDAMAECIRSYADSMGSRLLTIFDRVKGLASPDD
jgi:hypothetical protein